MKLLPGSPKFLWFMTLGKDEMLNISQTNSILITVLPLKAI